MPLVPGQGKTTFRCILFPKIFNILALCSFAASLLHEGLSEPEFYGDLVYKLKKD